LLKLACSLNRNRFKVFSLVLLLVFGWSVILFGASSDHHVERILKLKQQPEGVVFEIVTSASGLKWAIPKVRSYARALRNKWPKIKIAVVSHGNEQFALTKTRQSKFKQVHKQVKNLTGDLNIPVHICQTYAEMNGVSPEAFPKYVNVSTSGPGEIKNYLEFGYLRVKVTH